MIYLRIWRKYGCCIYPNAIVGKGFYLFHPVGIVLGKCIIGENCHIFQNVTIGAKRKHDESNGLIPVLGNNVVICCGSAILGHVNVADGTTIAANSTLFDSTQMNGLYAGTPATFKKIISNLESIW